MSRRAALTVFAAVAMAACGGGSDGTSADSTPPQASPSATSPTTDPTSDSVIVPTATEPTATEPAPTTAPPLPSELADLPDLERITVTTPTAGNGERPLLAWDPVSGAAGYALTLSDSAGVAYWAWSGSSTEVWLGGTSNQPAAGTAGPILTMPLVLRVVALDGEGSILAASVPTEIAP